MLAELVFPRGTGDGNRTALDLQPPGARPPSCVATRSSSRPLRVDRRDLLGGLIHEYDIAAA
jgi:hypothetical protein